MSTVEDRTARVPGDRIRLVLPGEPDYGRIARVATSNLALRLGFTFAEIEDLRIAVDETIVLLLQPDGDTGDITFEFTIGDDRLAIDASSVPGPSGSALDHALDPAACRRFEKIVADTVDEIVLGERESRVRLVKRY